MRYQILCYVFLRLLLRTAKMKSFIEQAQMYSEFHQNSRTFYSHLIGVPLILFSLMIFLGFIKLIMPGVFATNLASLAVLALLIYYYKLNWQLALVLTPVFIVLLWLASWFNQYGPTTLGVWAFLITFVTGWGIQLYGHFIEGKKPAFMSNISQALIAPLYLTAEVIFKAGYMQGLKKEIYGFEDTIEPIHEIKKG